MNLAAVLLCLLSGLAIARAASNSLGEAVTEDAFNQTCNYTASNIPAGVFFNTTATGAKLFPLEYDSYAVWTQTRRPWQACFGPGEAYDVKAIIQRKKLPCRYKQNSDGRVSYWEEHACEAVLKSNCYCYALDLNVESFCEPGYGNLAPSDKTKKMTCEWAVKGVLADGGLQADRSTVYNNQLTEGHYIAVAIWPGVDFHAWRLGSDGIWSSKPGMYLPRSTYRNGTNITNVEHPDTLGPYTDFCGYFKIMPDLIKLNGNGYHHSVIPERFERWSNQANIPTVAVTPLPYISPGWKQAYKRFWEITSNNWRDMDLFRRPFDPFALSARPRYYTP